MRSAVLVLLAVAGCLQAGDRTCPPDLLCPDEYRCDPKHAHSCVLPEQLVSCVGIADGEACTVGGDTPGICDAEVCLVARCGDGYTVAPEDCDGTVPDGKQLCAQHGFHTGTTVGCNPDCTFDFGNCDQICGDGEINGNEGCDGDQLGAKTCRDFGFYGNAGLACTAACTFATDACAAYGYCGDGKRQVTEGEQCDGEQLPERTCVELGFDAGAMTCNGACLPTLESCRYVGWHAEPIPKLTVMFDVWASSIADVWAVGGADIVHFNGAGWSIAKTPTVVGDNLYAIWGRSESDIYAVGAAGMVLHYDGTAWTKVTTGATTFLRDVWGDATNVWIVGEGGAIVHHDGTAWSATTVGSENLYAIWGAAGNDIWAAGVNRLLHYDGTWNVQTPFAEIVASMWGTAANNIYAVGYSAGTPTLYRYTTSWAPVTLPFATPGLTGVWGSAADDVWASGSDGTYHYDGLFWSREVESYTVNNVYSGFSVDKAHSYLGAYPGVLVHQEAGWSDGSPASSQFAGVWGRSATDVWAVGGGGTMVHFTGSSQVPVSQTLGTANFVDINGTPGGTLFALADGPKVYASASGTTWSPVAASAPAIGSCNAIWAASVNDLFVACQQVVLHYTTAGGWQSTSRPGVNLAALWGAGPTDVWVAGSYDLGHFDGTAWTWMPTPGDGLIFGLWGASTNDVWAVDHSGEVLHWNGTTWSALRVTGGALQSVHGSAADDVFAVGSGLLFHYDGTQWAPVRGSLSGGLPKVWSTDHYTFVVGSGSSFTWLHRAMPWL